jgi:hypothetical protein
MRPGKRKVLDKSTPMGAIMDQLERTKARIRAKVEHPMRQLGYTSVVKQVEAKTVKAAEADVIAKKKIENNFCTEDASSRPAYKRQQSSRRRCRHPVL